MPNHYEHEDEDGFPKKAGYYTVGNFTFSSPPTLNQILELCGRAQEKEPVRNTDYEKLFLTPEDKLFLKDLAVGA